VKNKEPKILVIRPDQKKIKIYVYIDIYKMNIQKYNGQKQNW